MPERTVKATRAMADSLAEGRALVRATARFAVAQDAQRDDPCLATTRKCGEYRLNQNEGEGTMPATVANRQARWYRSAFVAVAIALLGMGIAGSASSANPSDATDRPTTVSPIKHVIVVIGENQSFDHLYGTYVPPSGDSISNLLAKGIVRPDGSPGPHFAKAQQFTTSGQTSSSPPASGIGRHSPAKQNQSSPALVNLHFD